MSSTHVGPRRVWHASLAFGVAVIAAACAGVSEVSPDEIPSLAQQVERDPSNGEVVARYAAALFAADRCDSAMTVARSAQQLRPDVALGSLVLGQCYERAEQFDSAIGVYEAFLTAHGDARGSAAVQARVMLAQRENSRRVARQAIQQEQILASQAPTPNTLAVLPVTIAGDSSFQPLSRGLAQLITSDLALIQRFRLLERLQVGAILDELEFGQDARVDQTTAARVGRLMRAERMVQGLAAIPTEGDVRLEASVVQSTGEVSAPSGVTGQFRDMLDLEKELVIDLVAGMGYQLSEAERQALLRNGPQNLASFLAYSNGLLAEDLGDYGAAAAFYTQAVQADPGFQEARQRRQGATAAPAVQQATAGEVTTVANTTVSEPEAFGSDPARDALAGAIGDLAATQAEQNSETAEDGRDVEDVAKQPTATVASEPQPSEVVVDIVTPAIIRIVFRLP